MYRVVESGEMNFFLEKCLLLLLFILFPLFPLFALQDLYTFLDQEAYPLQCFSSNKACMDNTLAWHSYTQTILSSCQDAWNFFKKKERLSRILDGVIATITINSYGTIVKVRSVQTTLTCHQSQLLHTFINDHLVSLPPIPTRLQKKASFFTFHFCCSL